MKYDCDLIRDIASLYKDGVLSEKSTEIVIEHLSECDNCQKYYEGFSEEALTAAIQDDDTKKAVDYARKITVYRKWQAGIFAATVTALFTTLLPWFGYRGMTEMMGTTILRHPAAIMGIVLFIFAIWYNFKSKRSRLLCGYSGWGLWFLAVQYDFLTIPLGSTIGIQWGFFHYDIPLFENLNIADCIQNTLPGFYIGVFILIAIGTGFYFFVKQNS